MREVDRASIYHLPNLPLLVLCFSISRPPLCVICLLLYDQLACMGFRIWGFLALGKKERGGKRGWGSEGWILYITASTEFEVCSGLG